MKMGGEAVSDLPRLPSSMRFATPEDIDRLAQIAFAGGILTQEFHCQRPLANKHPEDVLASQRAYLTEFVRSSYKTVIVIEDLAKEDEARYTSAVLPRRSKPRNEQTAVNID